jgi:hypothetical protein
VGQIEANGLSLGPPLARYTIIGFLRNTVSVFPEKA